MSFRCAKVNVSKEVVLLLKTEGLVILTYGIKLPKRSRACFSSD